MFDQAQKWLLVLTFSMLTGPFFEPDSVPKSTAPDSWMPRCEFHSANDVLPTASSKTRSCPAKLLGPMSGRFATRPRLFEPDEGEAPDPWQPKYRFNSAYDEPQAGSNMTQIIPPKLKGPLYSYCDHPPWPHLFVPDTMLKTTAPSPMQPAHELHSTCDMTPPESNETYGDPVEHRKSLHGLSDIRTPTTGLLMMKPARGEVVDLLSPRSAMVSQPSTPDRRSIHAMLPSRISLIIRVLYFGVGVCLTRDVMALLSATIISTWGGMTRMIKVVFSRLKTGIITRMKMIHWPQRRPLQSNLEDVSLVEPSELPSNQRDDRKRDTSGEWFLLLFRPDIR